MQQMNFIVIDLQFQEYCSSYDVCDLLLTEPNYRYEVTSTKFTRDIFKELLVALVASVFMGFGVLFLLLWVGIYV